MPDEPDASYEQWMHGDAVAVGRGLMEHLPPPVQVARASAVLELCRPHCAPVPEVDHVVLLAGEPSRWHEAHAAFSAVRHLTLHEEHTPTNKVYEALLFVAEITAKSIFNASGAPAPFDHDSPWWIARNARDFVRALGDDSVGHQVWRALNGR